MNAATVASWMIIAGLVLIAAQVIVSLVTAAKAKKKDDQASIDGLGELLAEILKGLMATVPLGVLGFLLILVGAIIGGYLDIAVLFPPAA